MKILSVELILLINFISLLLVYFIKCKENKWFKFIIILIFLILLPLLFNYLYSFDSLIYNQIILAFGIFVISLFIYKFLKGISALITFILTFFYIIYFLLLLIVKGSIPVWTLNTKQKISLTENYYYEYYEYKNIKESYFTKYPKIYKKLLYGILKKEIVEDDFKISNKCESYYFLSDGVILKLDSTDNFKKIDKIPKYIEFYTTEEVLQNCISRKD